jgi:hypothetical protein
MASPLFPARRVTLVVLALLAAVSVKPGRAAAIPSLPFEVFVRASSTEVGTGETSSVPVDVLRDPTPCTQSKPGGSPTACTGAMVLSLEDIPSGITACFVVLGGACVAPPLMTDSTILVLSANQQSGQPDTFAVQPGTYEIAVRGNANDGPEPRVNSKQLTLAVLPFSLSPDHNTVAVPPGSSAPMPVKILRSASFDAPVDMRQQASLSSFSSTYDPDPAPGNQTTLTLTVTGSAAPGS